MTQYNKWVATCGLAVILIALFVFFKNDIAPNGHPSKTDHPNLEPAELQQIAELRNVGIALLENHKWESGSGKFQELATFLPESKLALQNLAIGRLAYFVNMKPNANIEATNVAKESALAAIHQLRELLPEESLSYRLEAQIAEKQTETEAAVKLLLQAAERTPQDPTIWYEISRVSQASRDLETIAQGNNALDQIHKLVPENVYGFLQWMNASLQEDLSELPEIAQELEVLITPLAPGIEKRNRYNVLTFLEKAKANIESGNLIAAKNMLAPIKNIITGDDVSRSDHRRLAANLLDFVEFDFSPAIQEQLDKLSNETAEPVISVAFKRSDNIPEIVGDLLQTRLVDLNLDGRVELVVLKQGWLEIFSRPESTERWTSTSNLKLDQPYQKIIFADFDYDLKEQTATEAEESQQQHTADLDLICYGETGLSLFRNSLEEIGGSPAFEQVETTADLSGLKDVSSALPVDFNNDGDLDLAIISKGTLSLLSNQGSFNFAEEELIAQAKELKVLSCVALDFDRDIDIDFVLLLEDGSIGMLENHRHGTFRWSPWELSYAGEAAISLNVLDADRNGAWDVTVSGSGGVELFLGLKPQTGKMLFRPAQQISTGPVEDSLSIDYDNDGIRDFVSQSTTGVHILRGGSDKTYKPVEIVKQELQNVSSLASEDIDNDGDLDLAILTDGKLQLLLNEGGNSNAWLNVALLAARVEDKGSSGSQRINHYSYGSFIEIRSGNQFQQTFVDSPISRFGLGKQNQADALRMVFTNGIPQNVVNPNTNQTIWETQILLGSCPYLYAWNGSEYVFVTDLLWAAPIGLQNTKRELVPARPWEYLKISGDLLQPQDGKYRLQITEELWEAAYFDEVELIAVDHPADLDIFTNEKVGPPSIAEHTIYQVREKRIPVSVTNQLRRDLLPEISEEDGVFAKPFTSRLTQGYTDESYLEIDFGLTQKPEQLTLFLTGWVRPTDTGLNVALAEDSARPGPAPPSISVPDENRKFVEVLPYCGFPGGKTKTIAIDLSEKFLTNDCRIRLSTSMELYWDQIFFSTEKITEELTVQPLKCLSADLHFRGVSAIQSGRNNGPEKFNYSDTITSPVWPTIDGKFTRFGDVLELVTGSDDQLLVIGTGDEVTMEFNLPEKSLPSGWQRDFILHCVGWDKDANLHTVTGQTVEPLPFVGMKSYPYFTEEAPHPAEYLKKYQTREFDPDLFQSQFRRSATIELEPTEIIQPE